MSVSIVLDSGDKYEGPTTSSCCPHGEGKVTYKNLYSYTGNFSRGNAFGPGTVRDPQGVTITGYQEQEYLNWATYRGDYVNGKRSGFGIRIHTTSGWMDEGEWNDDKRVGQFIYTTKSGVKFEQVFLNGTYQSNTSVGPVELEAACQRRQIAESRREATKQVKFRTYYYSQLIDIVKEKKQLLLLKLETKQLLWTKFECIHKIIESVEMQ